MTLNVQNDTQHDDLVATWRLKEGVAVAPLGVANREVDIPLQLTLLSFAISSRRILEIDGIRCGKQIPSLGLALTQHNEWHLILGGWTAIGPELGHLALDVLILAHDLSHPQGASFIDYVHVSQSHDSRIQR